MSAHIEIIEGEIAETILLPGDPLRAKWIANTFLKESYCFNTIRGTLGYTGYYNGNKISVMGTGMGIPSISIYAHELINNHGVKQLIRVGSAGSYQTEVEIRDIIIAMSASTNSSINKAIFKENTFAPTASFKLFESAINTAKKLNIPFKAGNVLSSDVFYENNKNDFLKWAEYGVLCVEMEAAGLYSIAAKYNVDALCLLTISDSLVTGETTTASERETTFRDMVTLALEMTN